MSENLGDDIEPGLEDFDDRANDLWSLFGKQAKTHDEAWAKSLKEDMDGVLIFAGLFSAALTAFVVPKIQDLKVNPADQSAYYQYQTVQMLDRISQQLASVDRQISSNHTPPLPYQFTPTASDRRVSIFWLISLVFSLSAALLATLVQQWARDYMRVFTRPRTPLRSARIRMFLFEHVERLPKMAEVVPAFIHLSLILFFWGIGDIILHIDKTTFIATVATILVGAFFYIYCAFAQMWNPQLPYWTPFSVNILNFIQNLRGLASMEIFQEYSAMKSKNRLSRDVLAIQWLINNINEINEVRTFVLAFIGSFNGNWGQNVWRAVFGDHRSTSPVNQARPGRLSSREGATAYRLCTYVRLFLEKTGNNADMDDRRRHARECIEAMASLVCLTGIELGSFGQIGEVLSKVGDEEQTNNPLSIRSSPLFTVRWTCLSLVTIRQAVANEGPRLQELAKVTLDWIARLHTDYGTPDMTTLMTVAERVDDYLIKAWAPVKDLHAAFDSKPWSLSRTPSDIIGILRGHEESILELERIATEAGGVEDVDWCFTYILGTMDEITHKLMHRLPGVSFDNVMPARPMISEVFDFPSFEATPMGPTIPVPPQLIPPGRHIQSLCTLGRDLRDIIDGQNSENHEETLKSLESSRDIPFSLRGLNYLMKRQIWRLLDLRDGGGFGYTIELFFLAVRQLELSSASSSPELKEAYYTGTFEAITSDWAKVKHSLGTQRILLDLLCDLVIAGRGAFSNFPYPWYIVHMLQDLAEKMVKGQEGIHINDIIHELEALTFRNPMDDLNLRDEVLRIILPS